MIELSQLEEMFQGIRKDSNWNIDGPMVWGYFFTDVSPDRLELLRNRLEHDGYRFVDMFEANVDEGEDPYLFLHVEKVETHTVSSLHERNSQLYALVDELDVGTYDGMDVGPVTS
jgi:hypothetical protein